MQWQRRVSSLATFTICPTPYNHKQNVFSASLNKTFPFLFVYLVPEFVDEARYSTEYCRFQRTEVIKQQSDVP